MLYFISNDVSHSQYFGNFNIPVNVYENIIKIDNLTINERDIKENFYAIVYDENTYNFTLSNDISDKKDNNIGIILKHDIGIKTVFLNHGLYNDSDKNTIIFENWNDINSFVTPVLKLDYDTDILPNAIISKGIYDIKNIEINHEHINDILYHEIYQDVDISIYNLNSNINCVNGKTVNLENSGVYVIIYGNRNKERIKRIGNMLNLKPWNEYIFYVV